MSDDGLPFLFLKFMLVSGGRSGDVENAQRNRSCKGYGKSWKRGAISWVFLSRQW